jgi:hypothetical protein
VHVDIALEILGHLEAAGNRGLTAEQVAFKMQTPGGTASARLSAMKGHGLIAHRKPYWFFVASLPRDDVPLVRPVAEMATKGNA